MTSGAPRVSVVVCCYRSDHLDLLRESIASLRRQSVPPHEILVVIDHNDELERLVRDSEEGVRVVSSPEEPGYRGPRDFGVATASGDVVAIIDDDAAAPSDWIARLAEPYADPAVLGVGGGARPRWERKRPAWLPREFYWVISCTWRGLPTVPSTTRNLLGCNMSFRRRAYLDAGGFGRDAFYGGTMVNDETEFCVRLTQRNPGSRLVFLPDVVVDHFVPRDKSSLGYFLRRCWREGRAKRVTVRLVGTSDGLSRERAHMLRVIPSAIVSALRDALRGRPSALAPLPALLLGTLVTAVGFLLPPPAPSAP